MQKLFLLITSICLYQFSFAQSINADSAKYFEVKVITVCGKVAGTHVSSGEKKTTILNIDKSYPQTEFTVVIFADDLPNFKFKPDIYYDKKSICVTGVVKIYKDKPEIVVTEPSQIKIEN